MNKKKLVEYLKVIFSIILIAVSSVIFFITYQQRRARSETICDVGSFFKDEGAPYEYRGSVTVTSVGIKAGTGCTFFRSNGSDECFEVSGIGTSNVTVRQRRSDDDCKSISHVSFFSTQQASPTPTPPTQPSPTPTSPTSPTPTSPGQPSNTPIPTRTRTPTATRTPTQALSSTPTPTPTNTPTPTPTETPLPTETPNPSETPGPSDTPTPTFTRTPTPTRTPTTPPESTATNTPPPGATNTPTEIVLVSVTEVPTDQPSTELPTVGTVTGWVLLAVPLALVILAFVF